MVRGRTGGGFGALLLQPPHRRVMTVAGDQPGVAAAFDDIAGVHFTERFVDGQKQGQVLQAECCASLVDKHRRHHTKRHARSSQWRR